ncbi:MAG: hypothetical protein LBP96_05180 [Bacteroidales bacterium]|jgi:hypothetical protein|nr:hypothetical protein [Bacteroidales bacterium]
MNRLFTKSEKANNNYLSQVIKIDNIRPHANADRLKIVTYQGANIIVAKDSVKIGDVMIHCAVESVLNKDFLSKNNQFEDKELNADTTVKGFFNKKGRVRAINLRGEPSRGFLFPPQWLQKWQSDLNINDVEKYIGIEFDTINSTLFSKKYVPIRQKVRKDKPKTNRRNKVLKNFDKLVDSQFNFHYDTEFLAKNMEKINPGDIISITTKLHGTSAIFCNILINRKLNWFEKLLQKLGVKIETMEYGDIVSSRGVIKNRYINKALPDGFYDVDIWTHASKKVMPLLAKGETVYAEIVGYLPDTANFIQKNHDYKCNEGEYEIYVYRVTQTNVDGIVYEMSALQVQQWCKSRGLKPVKELFYGRAKDMYPDLDTEKHWHESFLERLKTDKENLFMECNSPDCYNEVPHEGITIRNDSRNNMPALKLKTEAHYLMETKELDEGILNIEDSEASDEMNEG